MDRDDACSSVIEILNLKPARPERLAGLTTPLTGIARMSSQANPATHQSASPPASAAGSVVRAVSPTLVRRGPRGNLARFYREQTSELQKPIYPLNYSRQNDPDWFARIHRLILDLHDGTNRPNSTLTPAMVAHIDANIAKFEKLPIGRQFVVGVGSKRKYPDLQITGVRRERAIELSRALLDVTKQNPCLVRHAVLGYLYAVDERMQVRLTGREYAPYGRVLINLVDQVVGRLNSPWICWQLVGFEIDGEHKDQAGWFEDLGQEPTEIHFTKPNTPDNRAELDHIRVDVCFAGGVYRLSREFYEVMLLAGVTEFWKCVRP
jgi:hypothetical protein